MQLNCKDNILISALYLERMKNKELLINDTHSIEYLHENWFICGSEVKVGRNVKLKLKTDGGHDGDMWISYWMNWSAAVFKHFYSYICCCVFLLQKLRNPKVEKAEILESVVEFLKKDIGKPHQTVTSRFPDEQRPTCAPHHSYHDGMTSCLLRVSQFIASKSRELEENGALRASLKLSDSHTAVSSSVPPRISPVVAPGDIPAVLSPQHLLLQESEAKQMLSFSSSSATVPVHVTDPVWRPWPK